MLEVGEIINCYGIKKFASNEIFNTSPKTGPQNTSIIYAPNGVMKTSFAMVLKDLSEGNAPCDRIFPENGSSFNIAYNGNTYVYSSRNPEIKPKCSSIFVINSFDGKYELSKEAETILIGDEELRRRYDSLFKKFKGYVDELVEVLRQKSGIYSEKQIKEFLINDFQLSPNSDWPDIINAVFDFEKSNEWPVSLDNIKYTVLFNRYTIKEYKKTEFLECIEQYVDRLNALLRNSDFLNIYFTDRNARRLGKALESNNLFLAGHKILLSTNDTVVGSIDEWNRLVDEQLQRITTDDDISAILSNLNRKLTANNQTDAARMVILEHKEIIPLFSDIPEMKKLLWCSYCYSDDVNFEKIHSEVSFFAEEIQNLYSQAEEQSARWKEVVDCFNRRFKVPFVIKIENKANYLLKRETPCITFTHTGTDEQSNSNSLNRDELSSVLSMGEKRALYLLYILFDLECVKERARTGSRQLIIADDIADSFDYKNKYAIVEYLFDLSRQPNIDLLVLTHNFDFFRTVRSRLDIYRKNAYHAIRNADGEIKLTEFAYQNDFFNNVVVEGLNSKDIEKKKKMLLVSIPFCRNLADYMNRNDDFVKLTCFLHLKESPLDSEQITLNDAWTIIRYILNLNEATISSDNYCSYLFDCAEKSVRIQNETSLEDKVILAMAIRLMTERHLQRKMKKRGEKLEDALENQTLEWIKQVLPYLSEEESVLIDEINVVIPETIHLNSFMIEPLIDVSITTLKDLYRRILKFSDELDKAK